jgi:hypothetical protein
MPTRNGRPVHPSTIIRWITKGARLQDGSILKLRAKRFPGSWAVSDADFDDFIATLTADKCGGPPPPPTLASQRREAELASVRAGLDAKGY